MDLDSFFVCRNHAVCKGGAVMKKKRSIVISAAIGIVLIGVSVLAWKGIAPNTGTYLAAANGSHLIILDKSPAVISTENEKWFANLQSGDKILIFNGMINTSFPGKTDVYACFRLRKGDISSIPEDTLEELKQLGWISP